MSLLIGSQLSANVQRRDSSHAAVTEDQEGNAKTVPLSAAAAQEFGDQGFLTVPDLCDADELSRIRATLIGLFQQQAGRDEGKHLDMLGLDLEPVAAIQPQIINPGSFSPALLRTAYFRNVQAIARQLLGPEAHFSFDHSILKPAGSAAITPWHQDEAHHDDRNFQYRQISFWMPLQDATIANGCMRYIPKSNLGPLLPHRSLNDDPRIHAIECPTQYFDESAALFHPVPAGSCVLHDGRTLHSALPNLSSGDRLAYVLVFTGPPIPRTEPLRFRWIEGKNTAALQRGTSWRRRGGVFVLWLRRLRNLFSDPRKLVLKLQKIGQIIRMHWLRLWRRTGSSA